MRKLIPALLLALTTLALVPACGDDAEPAETTAASTDNSPGSGEEPTETEPSPQVRGGETALAAELPLGLLVAYSQFPVRDGRVVPTPGAARVELIRRHAGQWQVEAIEDESSNVFHKAMVFTPPGGEPGILTLGAMGASVRLWQRRSDQWTPTTLWQAEFGGRFNRMRDAEVADLFGDGRQAIAVATHDQGVVAVIRPQDGGEYQVTELDRRANTFIHEIEIGDLDGDGTPEVYATPSEPNNLDGGEQHGTVVRYVPATGAGPEVVADLGNRHAKEIWVGDVDGDGRDELYVAVEALTSGRDPNVTIVEPVEIRRYDHDTAPNAGVVIARIQDRLCRFLTVGDVDGDGDREMVAATLSSGLWLLEPGRDPRGEWSMERIDADSSGFEHASLFADLDGNGSDELYVASDNQGELRRYVWVNGRPRREVILHREVPRSRMTWNITVAPADMLAP